MVLAQTTDAPTVANAKIQTHIPRIFQIRACDECKRQKMKCSSYVDYPNPCKRCQNRRQPCQFTDKPKRTIKRQQKIRHSVEERDQERHSARSSSSTTPATETLRRQSDPSDYSSMQGVIPQLNDRPEPQAVDFFSEFSATSIVHTISMAKTAAGDIPPRVLQGIEVSTTEINETFSLFFANYSHHLGSFLDPNLSPDQYFEDSPLLFWTIVAIGSRQYTQNPTLLGSLAARVLELVWKSMMQTNEDICPIIESLILLATWAFPVKTIFKDMTFTMSGMAMNLAIQIGFHVPKHAQAFALKTIDSSQANFSKKINLWMNCVLCRLRSAASLGYPPTTLELVKMMLSADISQCVPSESIFQLQLLDLAGQATVAIFERDGTAEGDDDHLHAILKSFEAEFSNLEPKLARFQDLERLHFHIARLQIRVYYLSTTAGRDFPAHAALLYQDSITVILICTKLQESVQLCLSCPNYIWLMLGLAACALLNLLRSRNSVLGELFSLYEGRQSYFAAITLLKHISIEPDDGPGRLAGALTRLWTSNRAPRFTEITRADASAGGRVPQSRLAMSLFYETLQWYRDEYGGQAFLSSLSPRESGLPHSLIPANGNALSRIGGSPLGNANFQLQPGDIDLEDPFFANLIPVTDEDFTAADMFSSWYPAT